MILIKYLACLFIVFSGTDAVSFKGVQLINPATKHTLAVTGPGKKIMAVPLTPPGHAPGPGVQDYRTYDYTQIFGAYRGRNYTARFMSADPMMTYIYCPSKSVPCMDDEKATTFYIKRRSDGHFNLASVDGLFLTVSPTMVSFESPNGSPEQLFDIERPA